MGTTAEKLAYLAETKNDLITVLTNKLNGFIVFDASNETFRNLCTKYVMAIGSTSIGDNAFYNCSGLTTVTIPDSVTSIGQSAFSGCTGMTSVTIPSSVTSIDRRTFYNCSGLTSVTIPNSVTSIGNYAFYNCSGLTSVTIPDSVTSIGSSAFQNCSGLTSITIPDGVTSIGEWVFNGCFGLNSATVLPATPPSLGNGSAFSGVYPIYVPSESVDLYKEASVWSNLADRIQAIPT